MGKKRSHASPSDTAYKAERRDLKNKARKLAIHNKKHPNDVKESGPVDYKPKKKLS
jgi:hypothetical protein